MAGPAPEQVLALFAQLGQQLGAILDAALDVDLAGGTSDDWDAALARLRVPAMGEDARFEAAQAGKQVKGPPIAEVGSCIEAAVGAFASAFAGGAAQLSPQQRAQVSHALGSLGAAALSQYKAQATERKKGMFAHARAAAQKHQWDAFGKSQGYVLKCATCGAPRIQADLTCAFCGAKI